MRDTAALAIEFNGCINERDLKALSGLMANSHTFIDTAGNAFVGKAACIEAWRGFFDAYPEYRNIFEAVFSRGDRPPLLATVFVQDCPLSTDLRCGRLLPHSKS